MSSSAVRRTKPAAKRASAKDTREEILRAGRDALLAKRRFSMGAVAERAGVSRQAVYLHFADRYALLEALAAETRKAVAADSLVTEIEEARTSAVAVDAFAAAAVRIVAHSGPLLRAVQAVIADDAKLAARWAKRRGRNAAIEATVARLERDGALRDDVSADEARGALTGFASYEPILALLAVAKPEEVEAILRRALHAALLASPKAR